jgi:hypothetical protein
MGLDSLMAIELRNRLEAEVGLTLSATMAWNYPTIQKLGTYVLDRLEPAAHCGPPDGANDDGPSAGPDERRAAVAALSDDEALAALIGEGGR